MSNNESIKDKKPELLLNSWHYKSKYKCPECGKKTINSDGDCQKCGKSYQLIVGL